MRRTVLVLTAHSLRRTGGMLAGLGVVLAGFQFLLTQMASYLARHSAFAQLSTLMPDFVRTMAGPSALAFMSFSGIVGLGYFHPIVIAAAIGLAIAIATEPAAEVESRFVDLTLARGLTRTDIISRTVLTFAAAAAFVLLMMATGTWSGLACCTPADLPRPSAGVVASLAAALGSVMVCWAGVALAAATAVRRRAVAGALVGLAALGTFLLDYLGRAWEPAHAISRVSPFHYFEPTTIIAGQALRPSDLATLNGIGIAGIAVAYIVFSRRDI